MGKAVLAIAASAVLLELGSRMGLGTETIMVLAAAAMLWLASKTPMPE